MIQNCIINSPIGRLSVAVHDDTLTHINFVDGKKSLIAPQDAYSKYIVEQLDAYFTNPKTKFDINYAIAGTDFQRRVWQALTKIPLGETLTYGELAKRMGTAPRAIGQACRTNRIPIIIPCHRIVAASHLGGFAGNMKGRMADIKAWLLKHEGLLLRKAK